MLRTFLIGLTSVIWWLGAQMLNGYVKNGLEEEGLWPFRDMVYNEIELDALPFQWLSSLELGIQVHCLILKSVLPVFGEQFVGFLCKMWDINGLRQSDVQKDLVSCNLLIAGYVNNFHYVEALLAFQVLMDQESNCDDFTLTSVLRAVSILGDIGKGTEIHGNIMRVGPEANEFVISALFYMHIECIEPESLDEGENIPLKLLYNLEGWKYEEFILASIFKWSSLQSNIETGKQFHSLAIKLDRIENPGTTPWSALISGCLLHGWIKEALKLFWKMQSDGVGANEFTITCALLACLAVEDLRKVKELQCRILRSGYGSNVLNCVIIKKLPSCVIQACLRARDHEMIHKLLRKIQKSSGHLDITSASSILRSCSDPLQMQWKNKPADSSTFAAVLKACAQWGLVDDAYRLFNLMEEVHWIELSEEHFTLAWLKYLAGLECLKKLKTSLMG
ncbi:LOW QUALITY PROTEIN: Pentatricopeptide repeat [Dillenia turbinata]|uniref:Pentatricopeptide repeat n=1 Tax=Dillenia turbinata TaxID=194707 RepID=A0AAN8Z4X3_9MAGN